jgi:hypothetical protein
VIRRLLEAGPVGEEELDMIKMFCYNSAAEFCNRPYRNPDPTLIIEDINVKKKKLDHVFSRLVELQHIF